MNKKITWSIIGVIVLVLGYLYASPYLVLNGIKNAAQAEDVEKVSAYIDYPSVRQSFKDQMNAYMVKEMASKETDGWEALGTMIASTMVEKMVDAVVTPEGMTLILQGKDFKQSLQSHDKLSSEESSSPKNKIEYNTRYLSMNLFEATLQNSENGKQIKVIMERDGLSWKVKKLVLPLADEIPSTTKTESLSVEKTSAPVEFAPIVNEEPTAAFDHSGVQKGATLSSCYRDPCSIAKVMKFEQISQTSIESDIELTLVGGSRESESIEWSHETHKIQIHCSITKPTLQIDDQITVIPLNDSGVPGVLWADAEYYMQACHNYNGEMGEGIRKYGYNVQDEG